MKRENMRKSIITISAFLMPFTMFFISPAVIIMAAAEGIINASALVFALIFILSLFIGRVWCGWLCPCGGVQDAVAKGCEKKPSGGFLDYIKFVFFALWIGVIVFLFVSAGGIRGVVPLFGTEGGIFPGILYVYLFVLVLIVVFTFLFGSRPICRYFCPVGVVMIIGRKAGDALSLPGLRLKAEPDKCTECGLCNSACNMGISVSDMVKSGNTKNRECIMCGACADACKKGAINFGFFKR